MQHNNLQHTVTEYVMGERNNWYLTFNVLQYQSKKIGVHCLVATNCVHIFVSYLLRG
jgi:hypothetical protein